MAVTDQQPDTPLRVTIGGVTVDGLTLPGLMARLDEMVGSEGTDYVCFCEAHLCVQATHKPRIRRVLERASLVLPDGVSMTAGAKLLGRPLPQRVTGPATMLAYCEHGLAAGRRHFFYGGAEGVAETLVGRLGERLPGLVVAGTYCPPFGPLTDTQEREVHQRISDSGAEVLWVALGAPRQELWMAEHVDRLPVPLMLGVGAAFDFHSGHRRWAPAWIRRAGLEWVYRMFTGGERVFWRNARHEFLFTGLIATQALRERLRPAARHRGRDAA